MSKVISLAERTDDNRKWSLEQMLEETLREVRAGEIRATKAVLIFVDDSEGRYDNGVRSCNISASDTIRLCEITKLDSYMLMPK